MAKAANTKANATATARKGRPVTCPNAPEAFQNASQIVAKAGLDKQMVGRFRDGIVAAVTEGKRPANPHKKEGPRQVAFNMGVEAACLPNGKLRAAYKKTTLADLETGTNS